MICFINPIGGRKRAEIIFDTKLIPKLELVGIEYQKVITQSETFIEDFFNELEDINFTDIVIIGGDGLVH